MRLVPVAADADLGEHRRRFVPLKTCLVTLTDLEGTRHSVEVVADSLFEAAALALKAMALAESIDPNPGPASRLDIHVRPPAVTHSVTVGQAAMDRVGFL